VGGALERTGALAAAWVHAGRPVAVSIAVPVRDRERIAALAGIRCWTRTGMLDRAVHPLPAGGCPARIDRAATLAVAARLDAWRDVPPPPVSPDGMPTAWRALLRCPRALASPPDSLLEQACNLR
jgi:hypothetical protein